MKTHILVFILILFVPIPLAGQPFADLVVISVRGPNSAAVRTSIEVDAEIMNAGSADAVPGWEARLYLCQHQSLSRDDILIGSARIDYKIPAGARWTGKVKVRIPATTPAGNYYLGAILDFTNQLIESNENNNVGFSLSTTGVTSVSVKPDLYIDNIECTGGTAGTDIPITITAGNSGNASVTGWKLTFSLKVGTQQFGSFEIPVYSYLGEEIETEVLLPGAQLIKAYSIILPIVYDLFPPYGLYAYLNGSYELFVNIAPLVAVTEASSSNNKLSEGIWISQAPDLLPSNISSSENPTTVGATFNIEIQVYNNNYGDAGFPWSGSIYLVKNDEKIMLDQYIESSPISRFTSTVSTRTVTLPPAILPGSYTLQLQVDEFNEILEVNRWGDAESNNSFTGPILEVQPAVDLVATQISGPSAVIQGARPIVNWEAANQGVGADLNTWLAKILLSPDSTVTGADPALLSSVEDPLLAGGRLSKSSELLIDAVPGTYYLGLYVDAENSIEERDENNNILGSAATITVLPPPDLAATNANGPNQASSGSSINVSVDVSNQGNGDAPAGWVARWVLSSDASLDDTDIVLGGIPHGSVLNPGASITQQGTVVVPTGIAQGNYYLGVILIANFPEMSLNNNSVVAARLIRIR